MNAGLRKLSLAVAVASIAAGAAAVSRAEPAVPAARRDAKTGIEFVLVPGGEFTMGSDEGARCEQPVQRKRVADFWLGRTEVTVGQFRRFVDATGYRTDAEQAGDCFALREDGGWVPTAGRTWRAPGFEQADDHPVVCVSWNDATAFAGWAGMRLPSEAEWEFAAGNGPRHTAYSWGNGGEGGVPPAGNLADVALAKKYANLEFFAGYDDGFVFTAPVCRFPPNDFGLCDMTGNVWELVEDWLTSTYDVDPRSFPREYRADRGGGWDSAPFVARVTNRGGLAQHNRADVVGFRVVAPTPP